MKTNYHSSTATIINYKDFTTSSNRTGHIENSVKPDTLSNVTKNVVITKQPQYIVQKNL